MLRLIAIIGLFNSLGFSQCSICSTHIRKGPYKLPTLEKNIEAPSKQLLTLERIHITADVELAILYRSVWSSYCYNGGTMDPNSGCYRSLSNDLPGYEEATQWIAKSKCAVGPDCEDCWGSDAANCLKIYTQPKTWVEGKELTKRENNNHFPFHTCNVSWRCGVHKTRFPTFITMGPHGWLAYTEYSNGTEIVIDTRDYWKTGDMALKKTAEYEWERDEFKAPCFMVSGKFFACYDDKFGNFVEFKSHWACEGKTCYLLKEEGMDTITEHTKSFETANLKAPSIEDLRHTIETEHMLNEEMRYNFGLVLSQVTKLQQILTKVITSAGKVDDRLLGAVLGYPARSQFISEETFYLSPCADIIPTNHSNCYKNLVFKNGRWINKTAEVKCLDLEKTENLEIFEHKDMWFPEIVDQDLIGTATDFEGWTYYAREQDNLKQTMEWTKNSQSSTSISDISNYSKGFIDQALVGFLTSNIILYAVLGVAAVTFLKIRKGNQRTLPTVELKLQNIVTPANVHNESTSKPADFLKLEIRDETKNTRTRLMEAPYPQWKEQMGI